MTYPPYQVSSRKYRPQAFKEILGQSAVVTVLKNALLLKRVGHAYLFSGIRGTGKTTLARIFAKALNCLKLSPEGEPCNVCASCKEISSGSSLDVIEIDGASHRGIEDIRQINETVIFTPAKSAYRIYIIDEVHMLTKEAFNALLKTLEEPPQHVIFFLATTEIHKVPNTILSRCQKLHLNRIPDAMIVEKLFAMVQDTPTLQASKEALLPIARAAQGSLRDAESLYDYVVALLPDKMTPQEVSRALGIVPQDILKSLDIAIRKNSPAEALAPITQLVDSGVAPTVLLHDLTLFYRDLLLNPQATDDPEQILEVLDYLGESSRHIHNTIFEKIFLETVIIHIMRIFHRPTLSQLISSLPTSPSLPQEPPPPPKKPPIAPISPEKPHYQESFLPSFSTESVPLSNSRITKESSEKHDSILESAAIDTLLQFAAVEFSGILTKE